MSQSSINILAIVAILINIFGFALIGLSLSSTRWIKGVLLESHCSQNSNCAKSYLHYGMFSGVYQKHMISDDSTFSQLFILNIVCDFKLNACMYSCKNTEKEREYELHQLLNGETPEFDCGPEPLTAKRQNTTIKGFQSKRTFLNAGLWLSFLILMTISLALSIISCFTILIVLCFKYSGFRNAYETVQKDLIFYNIMLLILIVAASFIFVTYYRYCIWNNIGIRDTIVGDSYVEAGTSMLGYPYWLFVVHMLLSVTMLKCAANL